MFVDGFEEIAAEAKRRLEAVDGISDVFSDFEQGHPDEAILAWRLRLSRYPPGCDTPDVILQVARAQRLFVTV